MREQVRILGVPIDKISKEDAFNKLREFLEGNSIKKVYTPNPEIVMLAQEDNTLFRAVEEADLVLPDGIGLLLASKVKDLGLSERVTGVDTMEKLLTYCSEMEKSIYLFGGKPATVELAASNIKEKFNGLKIGGYHHGYFDESDNPVIIADINKAKPDILFVCLGAPKQEKWIHKYHQQLECKLAMGVGGSIDIYAGTVKRAPIAFQKMGLEWFYRLMKEPWRIKRMMVLPKFLVNVIIKQ